MNSNQFVFAFNISEITKTQKSGTDVLLDLLSIGTPPAQNSSSTLDILSPTQDNKSSMDLLAKLASPSPSAQASSPVGSSSMMDLLDGFGPSPSMPGLFITLQTLFITV